MFYLVSRLCLISWVHIWLFNHDAFFSLSFCHFIQCARIKHPLMHLQSVTDSAYAHIAISKQLKWGKIVTKLREIYICIKQHIKLFMHILEHYALLWCVEWYILWVEMKEMRAHFTWLFYLKSHNERKKLSESTENMFSDIEFPSFFWIILCGEQHKHSTLCGALSDWQFLMSWYAQSKKWAKKKNIIWLKYVIS